MNLPKTILVATDFSDTSDAALEYALDMAKQLGAKVIVLHAYEIPVYGFPDGAFIATAEIAARIMSGAQAALAGLAEKHKAKGVAIETVLRQGIAHEELAAVADEKAVDLIVVGTHGRKGLSRALLGSVAEKIVRTSTKPVLTIRGPHT